MVASLSVKHFKIGVLLVLPSLLILLYIKGYGLNLDTVGKMLRTRQPMLSPQPSIVRDPSRIPVQNTSQVDDEEEEDLSGSRCPHRMLIKDIRRDNIPEELYKICPEAFDNIPSEFLPGLRSPCWRQLSDYKLQCLPSYILAGVGKCGTTDVWRKIVEHPQIVRVDKEPRWWTRLRYGRPNKGKQDPKQKPFKYYLKLFENLAIEISNKMRPGKNLISGDGSPSVYWDNIPWRTSLTKDCETSSTPLYVIADVIRMVLPSTKIITVFRDPAERLYSDYIYENPQMTREYFHKIAVSSTAAVESLCRGVSRRQCVYKVFSQIYSNGTSRKNPLGRNPLIKLFKGYYSVFLTDWLRAFPRNQLMFFRLEDWHKDCSSILPQVYKLLELDPLDKHRIEYICEGPQKNLNKAKLKKGPMLEKTRQLLNQFYKPVTEELAYVLNDDRFLWNDLQDITEEEQEEE